MPDYTSNQFEGAKYSEAQNRALAVLSATCGPEVAAAFSRFYGNNLDPDYVLQVARQFGLWSVQTGMRGPQAQAELLKRLGIPVQYSPEVNFATIQQRLASGGVAALSTPQHYFFLQGYDPRTGLYDTGNSGTAYRGGNRYMTADQIRARGGGFSGQYLSTDTGANTGAFPLKSVQAAAMPEWAANNPYAQLAYDEATKRGIDPIIFLKQLNQESGLRAVREDGRPIVSPAGARGIAQLMPFWWQGKFNPDDPYKAVPFAADLMKSYLTKYNGDYAMALSAYNAGEGNVDRYKGIPPFSETQRYVQIILGGETPSPFAPGGDAYQNNAYNGGTAQPPTFAASYPRELANPYLAKYYGMYNPGGNPLVQMGSQSYSPYIGMYRTQFGQDSLQPPAVNQSIGNRLIS